MKDFVAFEPGFLAPAPEVRTAKIEAVASFDEHVEGHQQAEGVFAPLVVDDILDGDERSVSLQRDDGKQTVLIQKHH